MDILLYLLSGICMVMGLIGCIMPTLPGPPLCYLALFILHFSSSSIISSEFLILTFVLVVIIQILDYYVPIWSTRKFGGGKKGVWGSIIGLIAGILFPIPFGIIVGPFLGAVIGELLDGKETKEALKAGIGSFVGFLLSTAAKFTLCMVFAWYYIKAVFL